MGNSRGASRVPVSMSVDEAMSLVQPGARVVVSPGCGSPTTLLLGLALRSHEIPIELYSGLQIDGYPFLEQADLESLAFRTWHVMGPVRELVERGVVGYVPARASEVPALLEQWGADVTMVRVSPADRNGFHHLGPSASYPLPSVQRTPLVIAEIDENVPRTYGSAVHESRITATVASEVPMPVYAADEANVVTARIAEHLLGLLPERPTLQLGIGAIPEALTLALLHHDCGPLRFAGMATDSMVDLHDAGRLDTSVLVPDPAILAAELMGGPRLMAFADENPLVGVHASTWAHNAIALARIARFVSINSAIEVDLTGQVNAESVGDRQVSGVGGSVDYVEAAYQSEGGLRIVALPSTTADGRRSRIVTRLGHGAAVTALRSTADIVVTEHGVAELRGRTLAERRNAMLHIAHPDLRDDLDQPTTEHRQETR